MVTELGNNRHHMIVEESLSPSRPKVVAILPRGETLRNFVYTGTLDEIARGAELTLLSVIPGSSYWQLLSSRYRDVLPLRQYPERWMVRALREQLDLAHGRWLWSAAARERWRLRDLEANDSIRWVKRAAKKLACFPFANRAG